MATEQAEISSRRRISGIWFIPLLALALGAYLVIHGLLTEGPEIEIAFTTAEGLEQGKTAVKYRNVDLGVVQKVRLNDSFDGVIATVKMDRQAEPLLREDTKFWVVTARVGMGNISGLDTLISGAYIQFAPGTGEQGHHQFTALEQPPLTPQGAPGIRVLLSSDKASSVTTGDPVLYNGFRVGRVEDVEFDPEAGQVRYTAFIDAPYHVLVNSAVRFWDVSGLTVDVNSEGFQVAVGSLDTVLQGGIAFALPEGATGEPVVHGAEYKLYSTYADTLKNPYKFGRDYVVYFTSIKGLFPGAPVEFRGITIGHVERLLLRESTRARLDSGDTSSTSPIPALIRLEPARLELPDSQKSLDLMHNVIEQGVTKGLRASLETGNLLTGAKYVNFDYHTNAEPATIGTFLDYTTLPSVDTGLGQLQQQVSTILSNLAELPLDETVERINTAVVSLDATMKSMDTLLKQQSTQQVPAELNQTLAELRATLAELNTDSGAYQSFNSSVLRLNRTLDHLDQLTSTLAAQPNAVILPKKPTPDPLPEVQE